MPIARKINDQQHLFSVDDSVNKRALIVDDDAVNRMILEGMLSNSGFDVISAEDGQQAIQKFIDHGPCVILMDIVMPVLDGYQATEKIKQLAGERFVPIIFLTSVTNEDELAKCVKVGGDDFLTKPYSQVILLAKIEALTRLSQLYRTIQDQRDEIDVHNEHMLCEQKVAKKIFSNVVHEGCLDMPIIKYMLSPLSIFNGDILLAARTPSGGLNVLLGDATGHGLPAAIGAVPVSDLFYNLTENGATVDEIVLELNSKLKAILPPEFFFCACVLNISNDFRLLTLWHGGLPEVLIYSAEDKNLSHVIRSTNFPLGVVDNKSLKTDLHIFDLDKGDRIYLYSDGITEAKNIKNEQFTDERLLACFNESKPADEMFDHVLSRVNAFRGEQEQSDDLTFLEINADVDEAVQFIESEPTAATLPYPRDWGMSMNLTKQDFIETNPVSVLTKFTTQVDGLMQHRENIFVILSELYNNALDHGVLDLDSTVKTEKDGFTKFLMMRHERLLELDDHGYINITLEHTPTAEGGELIIRIEDSGNGFDFSAMGTDMGLNLGFSSRGYPLLKSLCKEYRYTGVGNIAIATYEWFKNRKGGGA